MNGQTGGWEASGDPAQDYKEVLRIFKGALAARRAGQDPVAYINQQVGPGAPEELRSLRGLSSALSMLASQGGEPMTGGERALAKANEVAQGMSLGLGSPRALAGEGMPVGPTGPDSLPLPLSQERIASQVHPSALWRMAGSTLPMLAAGAAAAPTGLLGQAGTQGVLTGVESAASTPAGQPVDPLDVLKQSAIGGGMSLAGNLALHTAVNLARPSGEWVESYIDRAGGREKILARAQQMRAQTPGVEPTLAEAMGRDAKTMASRILPRWNQNTVEPSVAEAKRVLDEAVQARNQVGAKYSALNQNMDTPEVRAIVHQPEVQKVLKNLRDAGVGHPDEMSAANLNDVRLTLQTEANRAAKAYARNAEPEQLRLRALYQKAADALRVQIANAVPQFEQLQREYGPYAQRVQERLTDLNRVMGVRTAGAGTAGGRAMAVPLPKSRLADLLPEELRRHLNVLDFQKRFRVAADVAPIMHLPVEEGLKAAENLWPGIGPFTMESAGGALASGARAGRRQSLLVPPEQQPQDQNPFFPNQ